jgi:hypothetical protein
MTAIRLLSLIVTITSLSFGQITVLESTPSVVRLHWEIAGFDTIVQSNGVDQSVALSFKGQNTVVGAPGDVALPGYSLFTGVAPQGEISVSIVPEQITTMQLAASPVLQRQDKKATPQVIPEFISPWISQPVYEQIRGIRTAVMVLRPGVYDKDTRVLKVMTRGSITIQLPPGVQRTSVTGKSEFETMVSRLLCNYPVAKGWRQEASGLKKKKSSEAFPLDNKKVYHFKIGDSFKDNEFNEGTTFENGLMKVPGTVIKDEFGVIPVSNVRLYASVKGVLPDKVPDINNLPDGIVEIPLLRVDVNKDGMVDNEDYFIAYVTGSSDWQFNVSDRIYEMNINHYDDYRHYWLTTGIGGSSMKRYENSTMPDTVLNHFVQPSLWIKSQEASSESEGGHDWIWHKLNSTSTVFSLQLSLPGIDTLFPGLISMDLRYCNSNLLMSFGNVNDSAVLTKKNHDVLSWGDQKVRCQFFPSGDNPLCEIRSVMVNYYRKMELPKDEALTVFSQSDSGNFAYSLTGLDNELVYIVKIGPNDEMELVDTVKNWNKESYTWVDSGRTGARYIICREQSLLPLPKHQEYSAKPGVAHSVHDLRNTSNGTGYLIITHHDFIAQAESLAVHKEKMGFLKPAVVDIHDVYHYFSGGNVDPSAIRNFLAYVKNRSWVSGADLDFVVLMGAGHYDTKLRTTLKPVFISPYYKNHESPVEEYFTITDNFSATPSCAIGRITCETPREAASVVRKIREYEDPSLADFSSWRNRALFVADDDMQGEKDDPIISMTPHHVSSDVASDALNAKWGSLDLRKVFLYEYEWDSSRRKPGATRAIINQINNGVGFVNYFGHGAYYLWADEEALNISDLGKLYNRGQYPVVSSFSCSVGKFDQPGGECFSSAIVKIENAGAVVSISSSRASYANSNEQLAYNFYSQIVDSSRQIRSVGTMFIMGKKKLVEGTYGTYILMGDPSISIVQSSVRKITVDLMDTKGNNLSEIKSMQLVKVTGKVLNSSGVVDNGYGSDAKPAYVQIGLFNPADSTSRKDGGTREMKYLLPGNPIFLGNTKVTNGQFEQTVLIPKKVTFNKPGVKLTAFSWKEGSNDCGNGFRQGYIFQGSADALVNDTTGPAVSIEMYSDSSSAVNNELEQTMAFSLSLYDPSGVDIIGTDPDEGLSIEIPGVMSKRSINSNFQFREGDFKNGTALVQIPVPKVKDPKNTLIVTSRDLLGNLSVTKFPVDFSEIVIENDELEPNLDDVCNFPNPVRLGMSTRFFFYKSEVNERYIPDHYRFVVKIYTLNGKLIKIFKDAHNGIVWDCRDQRGKNLSPDVYLYQVTAYSSQKKKTIKSKVGKVVIHPPR